MKIDGSFITLCAILLAYILAFILACIFIDSGVRIFLIGAVETFIVYVTVSIWAKIEIGKGNTNGKD